MLLVLTHDLPQLLQHSARILVKEQRFEFFKQSCQGTCKVLVALGQRAQRERIRALRLSLLPQGQLRHLLLVVLGQRRLVDVVCVVD